MSELDGRHHDDAALAHVVWADRLQAIEVADPHPITEMLHQRQPIRMACICEGFQRLGADRIRGGQPQGNGGVGVQHRLACQSHAMGRQQGLAAPRGHPQANRWHIAKQGVVRVGATLGRNGGRKRFGDALGACRQQEVVQGRQGPLLVVFEFEHGGQRIFTS